MSYATANGVEISAARGTSPLTGAWHYDLLLPDDSDLQGAVTLDIGGALTLQGTVISGGTYIGTDSVRVLAGNGGWGAACTPKFYQGCTFATIAADLLRQGGEVLTPITDATIANALIPAFASTSGTVGANVRAFMAYAPTAAWRFLPNGQFWIGLDTWPAFNAGEYQVLYQDSIERSIDIGFDFPVLMAGQSVVSGSGAIVHVNRVESTITARSLSARAWWQP